MSAAAAGDAAPSEAPEAVPAEQMLFADLCALMDRIFKKKKEKPEQDRILTTFFDEFRLNAAQVTGRKNCTLFPIMRLLLPALDRQRGAYNLKETKLGSLLVKVLSLSPTGADARRLTGFRAVGNAADSDFAGVAYFALKSRLPPAPGDATVKDVNDVLDKIAAAQVGGKGPVLDEAFSWALRRLGAEQVKWFLRVVLKDPRLGLGAARLLAAAHPDAPDYFDQCADLYKTCLELECGATRPLELGVQLFCAVSPMLSERLDVSRAARLPPADYCVEEKFDGERFQLHMRDGVFEYFSRRGHSYGQQFGTGDGRGLLTPRLRAALRPGVRSIILDGEMMGWHKEREAFGSKGMAFDIKKITEKSSYQPCFCVFDILLLDGRSLAGAAGAGGAPLRERLRLLDAVLADVPGVVQRSKRHEVRNISDILDFLNKAIEEHQEGVVVKDLDSHYLANRRNAGWYKVKPEYTEGTMVDLDLAVVGADRAADRRQGLARSFLVAVADAAAPGLPAHRWVCVGRVGTGLTHEQRVRVCSMLAPRWCERAHKPPPACLVFNREKPDFWVLPEHSVVVQVRATELIRSTDFGTSHTLRFPRVTRLRDDKHPRDAMTLAEFDALVKDKGPVVKLSKGPVSATALAPAASVPRRKRAARPLAVPDQFRPRPRRDVQVVSGALAGRKLCVLSGDAESDKPALVRLVEAHQGRHQENVGSDTWCCVAGKLLFRVTNLLAAHDVDVASAAWLRSLAHGAAPAELGPHDLLAASRRTRLRLCAEYDRMGDSYTELTDEEGLRKCFAKLDEEPALVPTRHEALVLDRRLFGHSRRHPLSFLRGAGLHFPGAAATGARASAARLRSARVLPLSHPDVTHVVLPPGAAAGAAAARAAGSRALVVAHTWLDACFHQDEYVDERPFLFRDTER